jgi:hypothetical protein
MAIQKRMSMHASAYQFVLQCAVGYAPDRVLEFGSYDVNGSVRDLFPGTLYVGLDIRPGPGVDMVWDGHTLPQSLHDAFDCVVSTETLEHAQYPGAVVAAMIAALADTGTLIITAASPKRMPHGCDGGPVVPAHEHYQGISTDNLRGWIGDACTILALEHHEDIGDVYCLATKRGA